jgi:uncharacterized membrane protein YfcA
MEDMKGPPDNFTPGDSDQTKGKSMTIETIIYVLILGAIAGFMSSLVGIGGGIIIVPALVMILGFDQKMAQGTSLLMLSLPVALAGAINYYRAGQADWKVALILASTFVLGGIAGSNVSLGLDTGVVKKVFAVFMIIIAFKYLFLDK